MFDAARDGTLIWNHPGLHERGIDLAISMIVFRQMKTAEVEKLIGATYDRDPKKRRAAVRKLCPCEIKAYIPKIWDRILELTKDSNDDVRRIALHTIIDGSPRERVDDIVGTLSEMRRDPNGKLRRQVSRILTSYQTTGKLEQ